MTHEQIESNAAFLIIVGGETTSTALSGCIYHVLTQPETFRLQDDITILPFAKIPYLYCVLETPPLYSPNPGIILRRFSKGGAIIDDNFVPEGV